MVDASTIILLVIGLAGLAVAYWIGYRNAVFKRDKFWTDTLPDHRKDAIERSRSVLGGQFSEQLAPYLPDFNYVPTECRFIGKPIDFIVFKGADDKKIDEVIFVEVKSGDSKLNAHEKNLKETIENKRVKWVEYRVPSELTKKKDLNFDPDGHAL